MYFLSGWIWVIDLVYSSWLLLFILVESLLEILIVYGVLNVVIFIKGKYEVYKIIEIFRVMVVGLGLKIFFGMCIGFYRNFLFLIVWN